MIPNNVRPIPDAGFFSAWAHEKGIDCLIRSADWYKLPPVQRYLYNMAASEIRMEDAKTETRVYTYERFEHLRQLILRSAGQEWDVACEAFVLWFYAGMSFGVVHLDKRRKHRGDKIVGDDPMDLEQFAYDDLEQVTITHLEGGGS